MLSASALASLIITLRSFTSACACFISPGRFSLTCPIRSLNCSTSIRDLPLVRGTFFDLSSSMSIASRISSMLILIPSFQTSDLFLRNIIRQYLFSLSFILSSMHSGTKSLISPPNIAICFTILDDR